MIDLRRIPSTLIREGFSLVRIPLSLLSTQTTPDGELVQTREFVLVDNIEASVKMLAGSLLGDETLRKESQDLRDRVALVREAEAKEALASKQRASSDANLEKRLNDNKLRRQRAEERNGSAARTAANDAARERTQLKRQEEASRAAVERANEEELTKLKVEETVNQLAAVGAQQRAQQVEAEVHAEEEAAHKATEKLKQS